MCAFSILLSSGAVTVSQKVPNSPHCDEHLAAGGSPAGEKRDERKGRK